MPEPALPWHTEYAQEHWLPGVQQIPDPFTVSPLGHVQVPALQLCPTPVHDMPHVPELYRSVCLLTHTEPHTLSPPGH